MVDMEGSLGAIRPDLKTAGVCRRGVTEPRGAAIVFAEPSGEYP
jgi:hypothetical protein